MEGVRRDDDAALTTINTKHFEGLANEQNTIRHAHVEVAREGNRLLVPGLVVV